ncbi:MAG: hypothetical protein MI802_03060 [Desulfobacterales bacterium]|nr:hypothetical protein [Desulfobacterales bacterium]
MKYIYIASILSLIFAVSLIFFSGQNAEAKTSGDEPGSPSSRPLPPIDRNPPDKYESASFGLG